MLYGKFAGEAKEGVLLFCHQQSHISCGLVKPSAATDHKAFIGYKSVPLTVLTDRTALIYLFGRRFEMNLPL
jgi:hypothetical protein